MSGDGPLFSHDLVETFVIHCYPKNMFRLEPFRCNAYSYYAFGPPCRLGVCLSLFLSVFLSFSFCVSFFLSFFLSFCPSFLFCSLVLFFLSYQFVQKSLKEMALCE